MAVVGGRDADLSYYRPGAYQTERFGPVSETESEKPSGKELGASEGRRKCHRDDVDNHARALHIREALAKLGLEVEEPYQA